MADNTNSSTEENIDGIVPDEASDESQLVEENKGTEETTEESDSNEDNDTEGQVESKDDNKKFSIQKKQTIIHKILYVVIGLLSLIILTGIILYFIGFFDEEKPMPEKPMDMNSTTKETVVTKIEKPKYKFKSDDINLKRINSKLALLTKYEILESAEIERQKKKELEEKEREFKERNIKFDRDENNITAIIDETNLTRLEMPLEQKNMDINSSSKMAMNNDMNNSMNDGNMSEQNSNMKMDNQDKIKDIIKTDESEAKKFLKFIQVATLKYKLYKSFLNKIKDVDARISICKNEDDKTLILIGPFKESESRKYIIEQINKNIVPDAFGIELTNEEFEKRCGF